MSTPAAVTIEKQSDAVVARVQVERFDEESTRRFQSELHDAAEQSPQTPFVLDCAKVTFIPSLTLAALIRIATDFRNRRQRFLIAALRPEVRKAFVVTRLDRLLELHDDVPRAIEAVRSV